MTTLRDQRFWRALPLVALDHSLLTRRFLLRSALTNRRVFFCLDQSIFATGRVLTRVCFLRLAERAVTRRFDVYRDNRLDFRRLLHSLRVFLFVVRLRWDCWSRFVFLPARHWLDIAIVYGFLYTPEKVGAHSTKS